MRFGGPKKVLRSRRQNGPRISAVSPQDFPPNLNAPSGAPKLGGAAQNLAESVPNQLGIPEILPTPPQLGSTSPKFGRDQPNTGQHRPNFDHHRQARHREISVAFVKVRPKLGDQIWLREFGTNESTVVETSPTLATHAQPWPRLVHIWSNPPQPKSSQIWAVLRFAVGGSTGVGLYRHIIERQWTDRHNRQSTGGAHRQICPAMPTVSTDHPCDNGGAGAAEIMQLPGNLPHESQKLRSRPLAARCRPKPAKLRPNLDGVYRIWPGLEKTVYRMATDEGCPHFVQPGLFPKMGAKGSEASGLG